MIKAKFEINSHEAAVHIGNNISKMIDGDEELAHLADSEKIAISNVIYNELEKFFYELNKVELD